MWCYEHFSEGLVVQIPPAASFISMHPDNIRGRWTRLQRGRLVYGGSDSSIECKTRLQRRGLVYRGQDSPTDRKTCLQRWRLVYGGRGSCTLYRGGDLSTKGWDLSTEGETRLLRGRLVYGGGDSSIEGRLVYGGGGSSTEGERVHPAGRCNSDFQLSKCILRHHFLIFVLEMFISCARMGLPR